MKKAHAVATLLVCCIFFYQPASAQAGFFLFNIIHDIFHGGHKTPVPVKIRPNHPTLLKFGMENSQIIIMQQYLIKANYLSGTADGVFGYQTLQAVKAFQEDTGLLPDGVAGPKTMSVLRNFKGTRPPNRQIYHPFKPPQQNNNGVPSYLYALPVLATAYTRYDEGCTDYTYRGTYLRRGLVAVDPDVIPLGTRLYIPGYGEAIADDIGGAIQGNHIDLAMDTLDEAYAWGAKHITVYVLPKS